jgi:hypothetical protein
MIGYTLPEIRGLLTSLLTRSRRRLVLVLLASATPLPGSAVSLPATRLRTYLADPRGTSSA